MRRRDAGYPPPPFLVFILARGVSPAADSAHRPPEKGSNPKPPPPRNRRGSGSVGRSPARSHSTREASSAGDATRSRPTVPQDGDGADHAR